MLRRTLQSALLAALLLATHLVTLTLYLNPELPAGQEWRSLVVALLLPYTALAWPAFGLLTLLLAMLRFWPPGVKRPVRALPWFTSLLLSALLVSCALYVWNLWSYRYAIALASVRGLTAAAVCLGLAALTLLAVCFDTLLFPYRSRRISGALVKLIFVLSLALPLLLRPRPPAPPASPMALATEPVVAARRMILLGVDGLGPEWVQASVTRGTAPALARLLRRGASGPLATIRPTEGPPVWATIFTGRYPRDHGVKSFGGYRLMGSSCTYELLPTGALVRWLERAGLVTREPLSAASRRKPALWNALNAFGVRTGIVRFWGTHPPEHVQGFMLSHLFHLLRDQPSRVGETLYPPDLLAEVRARAIDPAQVEQTLLDQYVDKQAPPARDAAARERELVVRGLAPDMTYERAGAALRAAYDPPFYANYFYGFDVLGHSFLRYAQPEQFGNVTAGEARRYGKVLDRYTSWVDEVIGRFAAGLRRGEVLLVVSGYGMHPTPLWRRALSGVTGGEAPAGMHSDAPDGFILAVGDGIRAGATFERASILDVAPTILYLMGLPVGRDMEGRVATEILDPAFAADAPVTFIPSYESLAVTPAAATAVGTTPTEEEP
jgi:predicted AlkP superfamily phosphohydrolase/phosphomutase